MDEVQRVAKGDLDDEYVEGWQRLTDEPDLRAVEAYRSEDDEWPWDVVVSVAEFLRDEPLQTALGTGVVGAIRSVPGVQDVQQEDREVWIVSGNPEGRALLEAVAVFLDDLAPRARSAVEDED